MFWLRFVALFLTGAACSGMHVEGAVALRLQRFCGISWDGSSISGRLSPGFCGRGLEVRLSQSKSTPTPTLAFLRVPGRRQEEVAFAFHTPAPTACITCFTALRKIFRAPGLAHGPSGPGEMLDCTSICWGGASGRIPIHWGRRRQLCHPPSHWGCGGIGHWRGCHRAWRRSGLLAGFPIGPGGLIHRLARISSPP